MTRLFLLGLAVGVAIGQPTLFAQDAEPASATAEHLEALAAVGTEGKDNLGAQKALADLRTAGPEVLLPTLEAFADATPIGRNYLRGLFQTVAGTAGDDLPAAELLEFVKDTTRDGEARRLAYQTLAKTDDTLADRLIPGMLEDPNPDFRTDAVARLIDAADEQIAAEETDAAKKTLRKAASVVVNPSQAEAIAGKLGELGETLDLVKLGGFLMNWQVIGPFDNKDEKAFDIAYPPEKAIDLSAEYDSTYEGQETPVRWQTLASKAEDGMVSIAKDLTNWKGSVVYLTTDFYAPANSTNAGTPGEPTPAVLRLGTPNAYKIYLNGDLVFAREEYHRGHTLDGYKLPITLKPGKNVFLVKLLQNEMTQPWAQDYQMQFRITDKTGVAIPNTPPEEL